MYPKQKFVLAIPLMISVLLSFAIVLATWGAEGGPWVLPGCSPDQCLNGGVCNGTMCDCTGTGYTGPFCETQDGECECNRSAYVYIH